MGYWEYKCAACGETVTISNWHEATTKLDCPFCKKPATLEKIPSAPNFVINGFSAKNGYGRT